MSNKENKTEVTTPTPTPAVVYPDKPVPQSSLAKLGGVFDGLAELAHVYEHGDGQRK